MFTEMGYSVIYQNKLQCIGFNYLILKPNLILLPWRFLRWRLRGNPPKEFSSTAIVLNLIYFFPKHSINSSNELSL